MWVPWRHRRIGSTLGGYPRPTSQQQPTASRSAMSGTPNTGGFNLEVNRGALSNGDANSQVSANGFQATHGYAPEPHRGRWIGRHRAQAQETSNSTSLSVANGNGRTGGDGYDAPLPSALPRMYPPTPTLWPATSHRTSTSRTPPTTSRRPTSSTTMTGMAKVGRRRMVQGRHSSKQPHGTDTSVHCHLQR